MKHTTSLPTKKTSILKKDAVCREEVDNLLNTSASSSPLRGSLTSPPSHSAATEFTSLASSSFGPGDGMTISATSLSPLTSIKSPPSRAKKKQLKKPADRRPNVNDIPLRALKAVASQASNSHGNVLNGGDRRLHISPLPRGHSSPSHLSVSVASPASVAGRCLADEDDCESAWSPGQRPTVRRSSSINPPSTCDSRLTSEFDLISYLSRSDEDTTPVTYIDE